MCAVRSSCSHSHRGDDAGSGSTCMRQARRRAPRHAHRRERAPRRARRARGRPRARSVTADVDLAHLEDIECCPRYCLALQRLGQSVLVPACTMQTSSHRCLRTRSRQRAGCKPSLHGKTASNRYEDSGRFHCPELSLAAVVERVGCAGEHRHHKVRLCE